MDWEIIPSTTRRSDDPALAEIHSRSSVEPGSGEVEGLPDKKHGPGFGKMRTKRLNDIPSV
jgi:hypothetical protein